LIGVKAVKLAAMMPGATRIIAAFVKVLPDRDLFVECACAALGRGLGLPIPEPYIVMPTKQALDSSDESSDALAFGSADAEYPSFYKFLCDRDDYGDWSFLEAGGFAVRAGVFDEWIANADRHLENILYGGRGKFILIDHANAIPSWLESEASASTNQIVERIYKSKPQNEKYDFISLCVAELQAFYSNQKFDLPEKNVADELLTKEERTAIYNFLNQRTAQIVHDLLKSKIDMDQYELQLCPQ